MPHAARITPPITHIIRPPSCWSSTDRLRRAVHSVINIRTSEHHIFSRSLLSVRMFGSWGKKRANASSNCAAL